MRTAQRRSPAGYRRRAVGAACCPPSCFLAADLPDESIHLGSAFLLAGYSHVVATMWPLPDTAAVRIARKLYRMVDKQGADPALALHAAVREVRATRWGLPHIWASHIHFGP